MIDIDKKIVQLTDIIHDLEANNNKISLEAGNRKVLDFLRVTKAVIVDIVDWLKEIDELGFAPATPEETN